MTVGGTVSKVKEYLRQNGPARSSRVKEYLMECGLSDVAARQVISRVPSDILKIRGVLPKNELFLCPKDIFDTSLYRKGLIEDLITIGNAFGKALAGLRAKGNVISSERFDVFSSCPVQNRSKKIRSDILKRKLIESNLIREFERNGKKYITFYDTEIDETSFVNLELEEFLSNVLINWLRKMNMVSYDKVDSCFAGDASVYAGYRWDIVAPSYLSGLSNWENNKPNPGFLVADIYMGKVLNSNDLKPILEKLTAIRKQQNIVNVLPLIIHDGMEDEIFKEIRSRGFIVAQTDVIWGKEVGELLRGIRNSIINASSALKNNPDETIDMFRRLAKLEGSALNLRGVLFEFLIGYLFSKDGYKVSLRKILKVDNEKVEADIFAERGKDLVFVECKGLMPGNQVTTSDIDYWVEKQVPIIRKWINMCNAQYNVHNGTPRFEFYFSGMFSEDVQNYCNEIEKRIKKYSVKFLDQKHIEQKMKELVSLEIRSVFSEQFALKSK